MYSNYQSIFLFTALLLLFSCKRQDTTITNNEHINAFPKKVKIYSPFSSEPDSLLIIHTLTKSSDSVLFDSFTSGSENGSLDDSLTHKLGNRGLFYYSKPIRDYSYSFYYEDNLLSQYNIYPFYCDGTLPLDSYNFYYNTDSSLNRYSRMPFHARCDDLIDDASYEYKKDTLIVNNFRENGSYIDTIIYNSDDYHYSYMPVFSFIHIGKTGYNVSDLSNDQYLFKILPILKKPYKLINKIISNDFVANYVYQFNTNNDVSQLDVFLKEKYQDDPVLYSESHYRYVFEY